jgi:cell division protein ZapA
MNKVEVRIMGQGYLLSCSEGGEERLQDAVARVDAAMCKIRDAGKIKARDRIAVLAALNLAFELSQPPKAPEPARRAAANAPAIAPAEAGHPDQAALAALLARLDEALLSDDGQLL